VHPAAARELEHTSATIHFRGRSIAVIGAGPAGLTYAERVAEHNSVTVFERETRPGGALRYAGLAPQFQGVEAEQHALIAFIDNLERACREKNVIFKYGTDVHAVADIAAEFDQVVVATGATYRLGAEPLAAYLLQSGLGKSRLARRLFRSTRVRNWLYHRARRSTIPALGRANDAKVLIIGDATSPGKTRDAIASAFAAARGR